MAQILFRSTLFLLIVLANFASGFRGLKPVLAHPQTKGSAEGVTLSLASHSATSNHTLNHTSSHLTATLRSRNETISATPVPGPAQLEDEFDAEELERHLMTEKLYGRIEKDFEPWDDGITLDMVERVYCTDYDRNFRLQIIDGEPFIVGEIPGFLEFNRMTKLLILDVISQYQIPDIDVMISTADECPHKRNSFNGDTKVCGKEAPLFAFDRGEDQKDTCIPYPDHTFGSGGWPLAKIPGWKDAKNVFAMNQGDLLPWKDRNPHLFFRGAPTGNRLEIINDPIISGDERFDARVTGWTGDTRDEDYVSLPAHCNYKYLMHLPGNGYSARIKYLLMCGSPVIFPYGGLEEFWYHLLEDGKNIKLLHWQKGHGDPMGQRIADAYNWMEDNPVEAEQLAQNAKTMIHTVLTPDVGTRYLAKLFIEYAKRQKFTPTKHQDASPFRLSAMGPDAKFNANSRTCTYCKVANREELEQNKQQ